MDQITIILYVMLGAVVGMIYSLRRIFILERRILALDVKITKLIGTSKRKK
ncbi:MAG: hypothetical protein PHT54_00935 [Candidatus Nanoarchaeia archaeon]|nr:hypothetical protein [Candidatus Nanoarchaeia archaeon]